MIRYVAYINADLDGLQLQSPHIRKHLVNFRSTKYAEALQKGHLRPQSQQLYLFCDYVQYNRHCVAL